MSDEERAMALVEGWLELKPTTRGNLRLVGLIAEALRLERETVLLLINAEAEADMLKGNPVSGAHHRAIERELARHRARPAPPPPGEPEP